MRDNVELVLISALEGVDGLAGRVCPLMDIGYEDGPLAVFVQTRGRSESTLEGRSGLLSAEYTVYVLHNTYEQMRELAEAVAESCFALQGVCRTGVWVERVDVELNTPDFEEFTINLFRRTFTVTLEYQIYEGE